MYSIHVCMYTLYMYSNNKQQYTSGQDKQTNLKDRIYKYKQHWNQNQVRQLHVNCTTIMYSHITASQYHIIITTDKSGFEWERTIS